MVYDIWSPYDPRETDPPELKAKLRRRLEHHQQMVRAMLPRLRREIENRERDLNSVGEVLAPYFQDVGRDIPLTPADLPELEILYQLILSRGGPRQNEIQEVLLRLIGATAASETIPFLLEVYRYTRRGDHFGPERRQLAMWGLARIALFHNIPEAYEALWVGLDDRRAEVRATAADLILEAYLGGQRLVPPHVVDKLRQMAQTDPDRDVRGLVQRFLREPWAQA
jgi:hypothetical protein